MSKKIDNDPVVPQMGADHSKIRGRINRIRGQFEGIGRMIESRAYCPDILIQTRAVTTAIKSLEAKIIEQHLRCCVTEACASQNEAEIDAKIDEMVELFRRSGD